MLLFRIKTDYPIGDLCVMESHTAGLLADWGLAVIAMAVKGQGVVTTHGIKQGAVVLREQLFFKVTKSPSRRFYGPIL
jgi:hypothetical protein